MIALLVMGVIKAPVKASLYMVQGAKQYSVKNTFMNQNLKQKSVVKV
jgi:hypothetical protein